MVMIDEEQEPILRRIQKLTDKAWSTTFPEERDALLAKAEALMLKYSIDQFKLLDPNRPNTAAPIKGQDPELRTFHLWGDPPQHLDWEIRWPLEDLFGRLAKHVGARIGVNRWDHMKVVGFPADLDFLDLLFLGLKIHLLSKVEPAVTAETDWETNLLALKLAGFKWEDIHRRMQAHPRYPYLGQYWERKMGVRFTGIYKKYRDAHPEEPANVSSPKMWREDFIIGYVAEIAIRLREMRQAALAMEENRLLPAMLNDKSTAVDRYFEELFPPPPPPVIDPNAPAPKRVPMGRVRYRAVSDAARAAGRGAARQADLSHRNAKVAGSQRKEIK